MLAALAVTLFACATVAAAEGTGTDKPVAAQAAEAVTETAADYKALYFAALERIVELEAELAERDRLIAEAVELAKGYRADWEAQREIAEGRKAETEQALDLGKTLLQVIQELKDTVNKQHEIILRLTQPKKAGVEIMGGVIVKPGDLLGSGILLGVSVPIL